MRKISLQLLSLLLFTSFCINNVNAKKWEPVEGQMLTKWAEQIDPQQPHPEYPRPQMVRQKWQNLNGLWNYAITNQQAPKPQKIADGEILVPFAIESALSGVKKAFTPEDKLWYETSFTIPSDWKGQRIMLHFGAVDYECTVWLNNKEVGSHKGSSDSFSFDITGALQSGKNQTLVLSVTDPSDKGKQPRGKQSLNPRAIWYTAVSGIWQTVWIEPVAKSHIVSYQGVPDIDKSEFTFQAVVNSAQKNQRIRITAFDGKQEVASMTGNANDKLTLNIKNQKLWSPSNPFLYDLKVELLQGNKIVDQFDSYFGMRKSSLAKDKDGHVRMMLNNEFLFQFGFLDQGWWPDGLLTPPSDEALLYDLEFTKNAGYNTLRKHIKQESDRFYYHCDKLGLLVWQDAVSGDDYIWRGEEEQPLKERGTEEDFFREYKQMLDQLYNFPSIVKWIVFNEGWGQYGDNDLLYWTKAYDPSRLASFSGWVDHGYGDVCDVHRYPGPGRVENTGGNRAFVIGEFGGLRTIVRDHVWSDNLDIPNYKNSESLEELRNEYERLMFQLRILIGQGLSGAMFTQITDVENEVNGMMTYNREFSKITVNDLNKYHEKLYTTPVVVEEVMPNSEKVTQVWRYTFTQPDAGWEKPDFSDNLWQEGNGFFGWNNPKSQFNYSFFERMSFAHHPKTIWKTSDIWIRRDFQIDEIPSNPTLNIWYDDAAEIYINGILVAKVEGRTAPNTHYEYHSFIKGTESALIKGKNTIAIHCFNNMKGPGNQAIDVAIMNIKSE